MFDTLVSPSGVNQNLIDANHHQLDPHQQHTDSNQQTIDEHGIIINGNSGLSEFMDNHHSIVSQPQPFIMNPPSTSPLSIATAYTYYPVQSEGANTIGSLRSSSFSPSSPPGHGIADGSTSPRSHQRVKMRSNNGKPEVRLSLH